MKLLFGTVKPSSIEPVDDERVETRPEYDRLISETEILQTENSQWEEEFSRTISSREKALQAEKEGRMLEALEIYLDTINKDENSNKLTIYNYAFDIDRVIVLYGKTKQKEKLKVFLEDKIAKHPKYNKANEWIVRLSKLNSDNKIKTIPIQPIKTPLQIVSNPTLGKQIDDFKKQMPEFNFYFDMPEGSATFGYSNKVPFELSKKLSEFRQTLEIIKSKAKVAENEGDYKTAIDAYEKMIIEECEDITPYERLIIIYSKLKWKQKEINVIERGISFFSKLKESQLEYVNYLACKYRMMEKAQEYISQDKKIHYYLGAFELYNPQVKLLNKWDERLQKLKQQ